MHRIFIGVTALALCRTSALPVDKISNAVDKALNAASKLRGMSQPKVSHAAAVSHARSSLHVATASSTQANSTAKLQSSSQDGSDSSYETVDALECEQYMTLTESSRAGVPPAHCQKTEHCMPQCRYSCTNPQCDQECTPECLAPECQTRCPRLDVHNMRDAGCKLTCVKPACEVVCPAKHCGHEGCVECKTVCHKPSCKVVCPEADCQEVCKEPKCKFNCQAAKAECAKPECKLSCDQQQCMGVEDGMPPLQEGMVVVKDVSPESLNTGKGFKPKAANAAPAGAPAAAPAAGAFISTLKQVTVEVMTAVPKPGSHELQFVTTDVTLPVD